MRYFLEISYKGTHYSGFQLQQNANTIQAEVEKAFGILQKGKVSMTGSSRTDAGVHALQNFFHFDSDSLLHFWRRAGDEEWRGVGGEENFIYRMNAILPGDIVVKRLLPVKTDAHCRFDAVSREYQYYIYRRKDPFLKERAFFFPYKLEMGGLHQAAEIIKAYTDFTSFSKRNTQVKTFDSLILESRWMVEGECLVFHVKANRFLRGMVRALVATMLGVGRGKLSLDDFRSIIEAKDCQKTSFAVPAHGLFLMSVNYPEGYFPNE